MTKESIYELQRIDCNCNNCGFMDRDLDQWRLWHDWHKLLEQTAFEKEKAKAIVAAENVGDEKMKAGMLYKAKKMRFLFDKSHLINYGYCLKFNKTVSFISNTCQIETQICFIHRKDYQHDTLSTLHD